MPTIYRLVDAFNLFIVAPSELVLKSYVHVVFPLYQQKQFTLHNIKLNQLQLGKTEIAQDLSQTDADFSQINGFVPHMS